MARRARTGRKPTRAERRPGPQPRAHEPRGLPRAHEPRELPGAPIAAAAQAAPRPWPRWLEGLPLALALLVVLRVVLGAVAVIAVNVAPRAGVVHGNWEELVITGGEPWSELLSTWQRWDALWYQHIVEQGYRAADGSTAFFPLYPLLSKVVSLPIGGNVVLAELIVSSAAFVVALWLLFRLTRLERDRSAERRDLRRRGAAVQPAGPIGAATLTVLAMALFPTAFFLLAPFTESVFLMLAVASFYFARTGRPWLAGGAGFLASLSRTQGVFLAVPIAYEEWRRRRRGSVGLPLGAFAGLLPVVGIAAFYAFQRVALGEQRSGVDSLAMWGYQIASPVDALSASIEHILVGGARGNAWQIELINLVSLLAFAGLAVWAARRLPRAYTLYTVPSLGLLFAREMYLSPLMSVSRYVLVIFPCFMVAALWLERRPWLAAAWLVASALLLVVLTQFFARWGFVA